MSRENPLFIRSRALLGSENVERLSHASVAVFGVGGVGSYAAEVIARSGIESIYLIDGDVVSPSNLNRQLIALHSTLGMYKTAAAAARIADINPLCNVYQITEHIVPHQDGGLPLSCGFLSSADCIIDAVDSISLKTALAVYAEQMNIPIISAMGCGNKVNPELFEFADIYQTSVCPLCRKMRSLLKKHAVNRLRVLYSKERPKIRAAPPCSVVWVPAVAGILIGSDAVRQITQAV